LTGTHRLLTHKLEIRWVRAVVEHQFCTADDGLERVVDLVRNTSDQLADSRQPLAVHELIAQLEVIRDVAFDADEMREASRAIAKRRDGARRRERRPVFAQ